MGVGGVGDWEGVSDAGWGTDPFFIAHYFHVYKK